MTNLVCIDMKRMVFLLCFILFGVKVFSQGKESNDYIILEFGGSGSMVSLNYERSIFKKEAHTILFKSGLTYFPLFVNGEAAIGTFACPIGIKYMCQFKESNHHIEAAAENVFSLTVDNKSYGKMDYEYHYAFTLSLGYRFEKLEPKTMIYYIGYSPRMYRLRVPLHGSTLKYQHLIKIGIGYKF